MATIPDNEPPDPATLRAAKAQSGKWHLVGRHGCLNSDQARWSKKARAALSDGENHDWCYYCAKEMEVLELRYENYQLKQEVEVDG